MQPPAPSPASSRATFVDDDWDILSNRSGRASPVLSSAAGDFDSDVDVGTPSPGDDIADLASDISTSDELESVDDEVVEDRLRESDRRVNAALASPLASTLDPFREPLPDSLHGSMSSSSSSALVLSFPDPLTPSQELQAAAVATDPVATSPTEQVVEQRPEESPFVPDSPTEEHAVSGTASDEAQASAPIQPHDLAAGAEVVAKTDAIIVEETNAGDLRKIASYIPRKQSVHHHHKRASRRLSGGVVPLLLQGPPVSHSWTTSIMVSILAIALGSALYGSRSYMSTSPSVKLSTTAGTPDISLVSAATSIVTEARYTSLSTTALLQTPGAGPSNPSTAAQKALASTTAKEVKDAAVAPIPAQGDATLPGGYTRRGSATPVAIRSGFWTSTKGKEKEVIELDVHHETEAPDAAMSHETTLLLEGPRSPLSIGYLCRDVLNGVKAVWNDLPVKALSTELLALSDFNFDELLDELIARIIFKTSSLLSELRGAVSSAESLIVAQAQTAKKAFADHHRRVRSNTRKMARRLKTHHRRARSNTRKALKSVREGDIQILLDGVLAHHERVKSNTRKGRKIMEEGFRAVVDQGQRLFTEAFGAECKDDHDDLSQEILVN